MLENLILARHENMPKRSHFHEMRALIIGESHFFFVYVETAKGNPRWRENAYDQKRHKHKE